MEKQYILIEDTMASVITTSDGRSIQGPYSRGIGRYAELTMNISPEVAANQYVEEFLSTHSFRPLIVKMARDSAQQGQVKSMPGIRHVTYRFDCAVTRIGVSGQSTPESVSIEVVRPW